MTWYAVFYSKNHPEVISPGGQQWRWYASSMDRQKAREWQEDLKRKGFHVKMVTAEAPSEWEGNCQ